MKKRIALPKLAVLAFESLLDPLPCANFILLKPQTNGAAPVCLAGARVWMVGVQNFIHSQKLEPRARFTTCTA